MDPDNWQRKESNYIKKQQNQTDNYRVPGSDKMNSFNVENIYQTAPNINKQNAIAVSKSSIRDPRLRKRDQSVYNVLNPAVNDVQPNNKPPADYQNNFPTYVNQTEENGTDPRLPMKKHSNSNGANCAINNAQPSTESSVQYPAGYQNNLPSSVNPSGENMSENTNFDYQKSLHLMQSYHQFLQEICKNYYGVENPNWSGSGTTSQNTSDGMLQQPQQPDKSLGGQQNEKSWNSNKQFNHGTNNNKKSNFTDGASWTCFNSNKNEAKTKENIEFDPKKPVQYPFYQNVQENQFLMSAKKNEYSSKTINPAFRRQENNTFKFSKERGYSPSIKSDAHSVVSYPRSTTDSCYNRSTEYDSYRSRSSSTFSRSKFDKSPTRSKSNYSRGRRRSRSLSRSRQRKYRSRSRSRSRSRTRSRSRSRSRYRSKSRSRSRSVSKSRSRYRSKSRSRSRSISKSRSRYRSRSRSASRTRSRYRSRSRSTSRSRYRSRFRSRSRSRSRSTSRNRRRDSSYSSRSYSHNRREKTAEKDGKSSKDERQKLIEKWRMNNCDSQDEMQKRLQEISQMNPDEILEEENKVWIRSAPADCYYERDPNDLRRMLATPRLEKLCEKFRYELLDRGNRVRQTQKLKCPSPPKPKQKLCKHTTKSCCKTGQPCSSSSESGSESDESDDVNNMIEELQRKQRHPYRLHPELWYNDPGEMNDGPLCRCSARARRSGIRHGFYAGENQRSYCDPKSNNAGNLYHYRITISPPTNFLTTTPTIINFDDHEFIFEGFSLISHYPIQKLPTCKVIRFNIEYIILYVEEKLPENFCIQELDMFYNYLFKEILELVDFNLTNSEFPDSCPQFHFMPRFVRELPENGRELLPMCEIMKYLLECNKKLIEEDSLADIHKISNSDWQNFADLVKGMVVTNPGMKPCSLRVDQLDRDTDEDVKRNSRSSAERCSSADRFFHEKNTKKDDPISCKTEQNSVPPETELSCDVKIETDVIQPTNENKNWTDKLYPEIVHFGIRPPQLSYAGNPEYQKAWRKYVKFRHLLANMPKPTAEDKQKLAAKENRLHSMRAHSKMKRDVTVTVSSKGFYLTGLMCDVVQHAMLIPVLVCHLRFHQSLVVLEEKIGYKFKNRFLLQLALTHPSYRENFGTNPDHARNSLTNCGIRQPRYGDRRIHYMNMRKRGINTLINIMSRFGKKNETESNIYHNERLEFLGDAVVEFITSIHLFHIFRDLEEGGLATYRAALVQNQHLAVLAKKLQLDEFMLYAHGSDLCHELELKHAMANCFEALMGALFLDGGIAAADHVFGNILYGDEEDCLDVWFNYPPHPLQEQEPLGDRKWIPQFPLLQKLTEFEEATGIEFKHIRLLARAFTDRSVGFTNLTLGSNQRMEFLGDSVLQLIASEYLYKYFPEHHEGHLSLLRSSLVNNKTQSVVCDDLGMTKYAVYANPKVELKIKDRADLLEAFLGALYVDNGLEICQVFCDVCFFPRLQIFIMNQDWNDPKSKLQQCCLTLRTMDKVEPDIPIYKVVECKGPTNTRVYTVAVYFRNKRLAEATGHSIQQAEMNAAQKAMEISGPLFPQLDHQKRVIAKSLKTQKWPNRTSWSLESAKGSPSSSSNARSPNSD